MAIRRWAVRPDTPLQLSTGETVMVCGREAMREAFLDGEAFIAQSGGIFTVVSFRARTDVDGEMVTISAVCEWKDRADARPQPERPAEPAPAIEPEETAAVAEILAAGDGSLEGDEEDGEPEEDLSSVPEHLRPAVA